jgi:NTP pyrophosphatase (non-canonical NTP hydrolase)
LQYGNTEAQALDRLAQAIYETATEKGFNDVTDGIGIDHYLRDCARIALIHDEASEALRELREPTTDWSKVADELADVIIRCLHMGEVHGLRLGDAVVLKMKKNEGRPHKHGKRF